MVLIINPFCFHCHEELRRAISGPRLICYSCDRIYSLDFSCQPCSDKKQTKVPMEVVAPGIVRCPVCGNEREAPGLSPKTTMTREGVTKVQRSLSSIPRERRGLRSIPSIPRPATSREVIGTKTPIRRHDRQAPLIPEHPKPEIEENESYLIVIAEFPGHHLDQIQWHKEGNILIIQSTILSWPHEKDGVELPDWAGEPTKIDLRNGILVMKFAK